MKLPRRTLPSVGLLAALLATTACGPQTSSDVRMNSQPIDVLFGSTASPSPVSLPPIAPGANPQPHFPSLVEPQLPAFDTIATPPPAPIVPTTTPASTPCPTEARPGVKEIAPPRVTKAPAPQTYTFTRVGTAQRTLPTAAVKKLDGTFVRTIGVARQADATQYGVDAFLFDVTEVGADAKVVNTYLVSPQGSTDGAAVPAGLYLSKVQSTSTAGSGIDVFEPLTPLELMPFPAAEGATWHSAATDPRSQVTFEVSGTVRAKKRLNFCGQGVDSWDIQLTGQIAGPGRVVNITSLVYDVGTQYGGLFLHDELEQNGTDTDGQYQSKQASTIAKEPDAAK